MVIMDSDIKMTRLTMMVVMMMVILTMMMLMIMVMLMLMLVIMVMTMLSKLLITHCFRQDHMNDLTTSPLCLTQRGPPVTRASQRKTKESFYKRKRLNSHKSNMAAVLLFRDTNMADVTSCERGTLSSNMLSNHLRSVRWHRLSGCY